MFPKFGDYVFKFLISKLFSVTSPNYLTTNFSIIFNFKMQLRISVFSINSTENRFPIRDWLNDSENFIRYVKIRKISIVFLIF